MKIFFQLLRIIYKLSLCIYICKQDFFVCVINFVVLFIIMLHFIPTLYIYFKYALTKTYRK